MQRQFSVSGLQWAFTVVQDDKAIHLTIYTGGSQC